MPRAIDDRLESWPALERSIPPEDRGLLIGNGASIAVWSRFHYESLYVVASDQSQPDHLTPIETRVFHELDTRNFEKVLSALITAGRIWGIYDKPPADIDDLRLSYRRVRASLIRAVKEVHVPFSEVDDHMKARLREVFSAYSYVYSSNYDLLLYWSMMNDRERFKDFVWGRDGANHRNLFDVTDTDLWQETTPVTKVLFLHGGLHLYKNGEGQTFKKLAGEDSNLLDLFDVQGDAIPLFISEGTSRDKLSAIARNDYLSFAYERFAKHRGSLVVFGHSLTSEFDQHLIDAIKKWKRYDQQRVSFQHVPSRRVVAISVRPQTESHSVIEFKSRLSRALSDYEMHFFNSETHPLGSADWRVSS